MRVANLLRRSSRVECVKHHEQHDCKLCYGSLHMITTPLAHIDTYLAMGRDRTDDDDDDDDDDDALYG